MAVAVFPPGGPGVKYPAPNGITYIWDDDNNRWTVESVGKKGTATVAMADDAPQSPAPGDLWFCTKADNVGLFIYYLSDGMMEGVWVDTMNADTLAFPPVKVSSDRPLNNNEGDLWYDTTDPNGGKLYIYVGGDFERPAPSYLDHTELQDRVALLENTSEILNEYKCTLTNSTGGSKPNPGNFKVANTNPNYVSKIRINGKDIYDNPLPIIHEGDGLEMLHEENGHSHRFRVLSNEEGPYGDGDLEIGVSFIGGDDDSIKTNDHYLFRFHQPHTDVDEFAHLDRDQTFTGENTFDGDVIFTGNVTLPDNPDDNSVSEDGDNEFTGDNKFTGGFTVTGNINTGNAIKLNGGSTDKQGIVAKKNNTGTLFYDTANDAGKRLSWGTNKIWMYVDTVDTKGTLRVIGNGSDDNHQFIVRDKDSNENLVIEPSGNTTIRGAGLTFKPKGLDNFDQLFSSRIKVNHPEGWDSTTHGEFGFYIDISQKNTHKNRFVIGGRAGREKAFEVYDDGEGRARVYGSLTANNKIYAGGDVEIRASLGPDDDLTATEAGKVYLITSVDLTQQGAASDWLKAGSLNPSVGSIFKCVSDQTLKAGNEVQEFLGENHLNVVGDINAGGEISGDDIEGHTFLFSGDGALQGNTSIENATLNGVLSVDGRIDLSNASVSNTAPLPKSWFKTVLKEFNNEFRTIYINEGTNGTTDPAIEIKASGTSSNIKIKTSSGGTGWGVNVGSSLMYGGTSSSPWMATSPQHFATAAYVEQEIAAAGGGGGSSWGLKFSYTNISTSVTDGKFTAQNTSGTLKFLINHKTVDGIEWYDTGEMGLKNLDFVSAGGPGPMYTVRSADDETKILRQGFAKTIQYTGNYMTMIVDNNQINTGGMTIGGNYYITIGGLF